MGSPVTCRFETWAAAFAAIALSVICHGASYTSRQWAARVQETEPETDPPHLVAVHRPGDLASAPAVPVRRSVLEAVGDKVGRRVVCRVRAILVSTTANTDRFGSARTGVRVRRAEAGSDLLCSAGGARRERRSSISPNFRGRTHAPPRYEFASQRSE